ncbi:hypothetical protein MPTK1_1g04960 [Marchantia polymorpha subsp. ruderalis]|nr:hypothetical protein MARPO_0005s0112 [Marchantia polymorpha]PTQ48470.1 hypothetical protein MARPO_0005s0113 [Marchantia polymorpha]BBM97338.1 hypothetical protein Mp_1g04960 [Marchantia polymorpha subsp. ruderalis]BBM97339.1 hypothetical protein Mp_1g04970 [Marchantia polymorpha subsp. ruderalis]|eukprot:PTQ48469.1 hypothetical protein MARPO_0005s0112 [Marchantia polymorpha]
MSSTFEERTVELNIVSAVDLKKVKTLGEQHCYVVAFVYRNQQKATKADQTGGLNPVWNATLALTCDEQLLRSRDSFLTVEIHSHGTLRNKLVGSVTVPLHELLARDGQKASDQVMAFQVLRPSGKPKGTLNMAVRLGEVRTVQRYQSQQQMPFGGMGLQQGQYPAAGFSAAGPSYRPPFTPQPQQYGAMGYPPMMQQPQMMYGGASNMGMGMGGYGGGYGGYPQQRQRRSGGMGFGTGLMGGALGGLLVGDMLNDFGDNDCGDYGGGDGGDMGDMGGE